MPQCESLIQSEQPVLPDGSGPTSLQAHAFSFLKSHQPIQDRAYFVILDIDSAAAPTTETAKDSALFVPLHFEASRRQKPALPSRDLH